MDFHRTQRRQEVVHGDIGHQLVAAQRADWPAREVLAANAHAWRIGKGTNRNSSKNGEIPAYIQYANLISLCCTFALAEIVPAVGFSLIKKLEEVVDGFVGLCAVRMLDMSRARPRNPRLRRVAGRRQRAGAVVLTRETRPL